MSAADELIALLESIGDTTPESPDEDWSEELAALVEEYPAIAPYSDYLDLLRATGGVYVDNADVDLGFYGFAGRLVPSFDEGLFLDEDRYFLFGETMHQKPPSDSILLAFDTASGTDRVLLTDEDREHYTPFADSLRDFLAKMSLGDYPPRVRNVSE